MSTLSSCRKLFNNSRYKPKDSRPRITTLTYCLLKLSFFIEKHPFLSRKRYLRRSLHLLIVTRCDSKNASRIAHYLPWYNPHNIVDLFHLNMAANHFSNPVKFLFLKHVRSKRLSQSCQSFFHTDTIQP